MRPFLGPCVCGMLRAPGCPFFHFEIQFTSSLDITLMQLSFLFPLLLPPMADESPELGNPWWRPPVLRRDTSRWQTFKHHDVCHLTSHILVLVLILSCNSSHYMEWKHLFLGHATASVAPTSVTMSSVQVATPTSLLSSSLKGKTFEPIVFLDLNFIILHPLEWFEQNSLKTSLIANCSWISTRFVLLRCNSLEFEVWLP